MVSAAFLALKIIYLIKQADKKQYRISDKTLKMLANKEKLTIPYLADLKYTLEELGYLLGSLKQGKYAIVAISSLEGRPFLNITSQQNEVLNDLTEEALFERLALNIPNQSIQPEDDSAVGDDLLKADRILKQVFTHLVQVAKQKKAITYLSLAKKSNPAIHHRALAAPMAKIKAYCDQKLIPNLTRLVVKGTDKDISSINFNEICDYSWETEQPLFEKEHNLLVHQYNVPEQVDSLSDSDTIPVTSNTIEQKYGSVTSSTDSTGGSND